MVGELQLLAHPAVPVLRQRLGQLHADAVHLQVVAVAVRGEQLVGEIGDRLAHRHQLERQHINLPGVGRPLARSDEVGDAQEAAALLAREGEPESFGRIRSRLGQHDDIVTFRHRREIPIHHRGVGKDAVGGQPVQPVPQPRAAFGFHQFLV